MTMAALEHVNLTVSNPEREARMLMDLFGWKIRWQGEATSGNTIHVGLDEFYIALFAPFRAPNIPAQFAKGAPLNHVAIVVDDLDAVECKANALGLHTFNHGHYEPGRRFYFFTPDGIEYEIVSYAP